MESSLNGYRPYYIHYYASLKRSTMSFENLYPPQKKFLAMLLMGCGVPSLRVGSGNRFWIFKQKCRFLCTIIAKNYLWPETGTTGLNRPHGRL